MNRNSLSIYPLLLEPSFDLILVLITFHLTGVFIVQAINLVLHEDYINLNCTSLILPNLHLESILMPSTIARTKVFKEWPTTSSCHSLHRSSSTLDLEKFSALLPIQSIQYVTESGQSANETKSDEISWPAIKLSLKTSPGHYSLKPFNQKEKKHH